MCNYEVIKDVVTLAMTGFGLWIAYQGLTTWKAQAKGVKEFETAYNLRYSVLKVREGIKSVRHPAIWPSEDLEAKKHVTKKYEGTEVEIEKVIDKSHAYVYEMRWEKITNASTEMESHLLAAELLWGSEILELTKELNQQITRLSIAVKQYFDSSYRTKPYEEIEAIVHRNMDESDNFSKEVQGSVDKILNYIESKVS